MRTVQGLIKVTAVLYFATLTTPNSKAMLQQCLVSLLAAVDTELPPAPLYQLYYKQAVGSSEHKLLGHRFEFPLPSTDLAFDDALLGPVQEAWKTVMGTATGDEGIAYMSFQEREGVGDDDSEL